jgi:hypothetical protein
VVLRPTFAKAQINWFNLDSNVSIYFKEESMKRLLTCLLALMVCFSLTTVAAENGENVYHKVWDSATDDVPEDLWDIEYMGDMDQDGLREFAVCTDEGGAVIYLYECVANNEYAMVWSYAISETYCADSYVICKGDLDGDGLEEIIAGVATGGAGQFGVHIFEWDGTNDNTYVLQTMYDVLDGQGGSITICKAGDFDGDGVQELFLGETINDDIFIVSLDPSSDFSFPSWNIEFEDHLDDAADYSLWGFTSGDFDGDGFLELACTEWDYNALIVIQVDAADTYSRELWWNDMTFDNDGAALRSLCAYDLDDDGFTEILIPSTNGILYSVTNNGTFVDLDQNPDAVDSLIALPDITGAALGDQDMDFGNIGEPDIYVAGWYGIYDIEYANGAWTYYTVLEDTLVRWQQSIVGDFDQDGLKDFALARRDGPGYVEVWEHEPLSTEHFTKVFAAERDTHYYQIRGDCAGSDLDEDGLKEVFITDYRSGGFIHGFEVVADNTLEWIWSSDTIGTTVYAANRNVVTGDLDNDGIGEVIFTTSANAGDTDPGGIRVYEWDGSTDNGFSVYAVLSIDDNLLTDRYRFEAVKAPADIDDDGVTEMLIANNGSDHTIGDRFYILSVDGDFESGLYSSVIEATWNQGEHDFNGSPYFGDYGDLDGDGTMEVVFAAWDHGGLFIVDVTGADTYEYVNYISADPLKHDAVAYGGTAIADFDGDGRDEVISPMYTGASEDYYTTILDIDGTIADATEENSVGFVRGPWLGAGIGQCGAADFDGNGRYEFYGSNYTPYTMEFTCVGTDPKLPESWTVQAVVANVGENYGISTGAFALDTADDLDGDGKPEVVIGYLDITDRTVFLRVAEYNQGVFVEDNWRIITPDDYKLSQNYPNPFNPTTQISYEIPLTKDVTLTVYDMLGREVTTLVNAHQGAGQYTVTWNGKNSAGEMVSAGTYIYQLKAGHVTKTQTMTLLK